MSRPETVWFRAFHAEADGQLADPGDALHEGNSDA
jgi:hypothetical protein